MRVAETFYSLQGEGELTGVPSFFIRTSGCNLRCSWCDTPYASWRPEGAERTVAEIVSETKLHPGRHAVLTGGEPMIAPELPALAAALRAEGFHITIETAGTVAPPAGLACDLASISPKLANSGMEERLRVAHDVLASFATDPKAWFKFVARDETDLLEIDAFASRFGIPSGKILVMPEGRSSAELDRHALEIAPRCIARGWRFCDRLHVRLWGDRRGV